MGVLLAKVSYLARHVEGVLLNQQVVFLVRSGKPKEEVGVGRHPLVGQGRVHATREVEEVVDFATGIGPFRLPVFCTGQDKRAPKCPNLEAPISEWLVQLAQVRPHRGISEAVGYCGQMLERRMQLLLHRLIDDLEFADGHSMDVGYLGRPPGLEMLCVQADEFPVREAAQDAALNENFKYLPPNDRLLLKRELLRHAASLSLCRTLVTCASSAGNESKTLPFLPRRSMTWSSPAAAVVMGLAHPNKSNTNKT